MEDPSQIFLQLISNINSVSPENAQTHLQNLRFMYTSNLDPQTIGFLMFRLADTIIKSKQINEAVIWLHQTCIYDIIEKSIESEFRVGSQAVRHIFDVNHDFYKHNGIDISLKYPLGMNRKLNLYQPEAGQEVDVVKPYITSTSYCSWTRCKIISKQNKKYTIKYHNSQIIETKKDLPFFDKLGSRTIDYDWRMSLQIGDIIDGFNKIWYPSTVVEVGVQNGSKRVRVSFRRFSEAGQKTDYDGNRYDGLGPNQDDWIDVLSSKIQRPGKMSAEQICYYSHTAQQYVLDDTYDLIFEKQYQQEPFYGIMRTSFCRSSYMIHFLNHFQKHRGNEVFLQVLRKRQNHIDSIVNIQIVIGNTLPYVPRMAINKYFASILYQLIQYLKDNNKIFNPNRLDATCYVIEIIGRRIYTLTQKHNILNNLRKDLILEFIKQNLQKQLITSRYIYDLIKPLRSYKQHEKVELHEYFQQNQIFYKLIQNNVHEQILSRSGQFIRYLIDNKLIGWVQMEYLWNIVPHSDFRGRTAVQKLIGDISKDFPFEFTSKIVDKLLATKQTQLTIDKLNLLRTLKDKQLNTQYKVKILNFLWQCLTVKSTNIKQNVEEEIQNVFKGFISTIKQDKLKLEVLRAIINRIKQITVIRSQMQLFKEFILTYPTKTQMGIFYQHDVPSNITQVVDYLKRQNIYGVLNKLLALARTKEKIQAVLSFTSFIFSNDLDDVTGIIREIYQILGPSDEFLLWAKNITKRAINFFVEIYQRVDNMQRFQKISIKGLEAIKAILLDINVYAGNIKIIEKKKTTVIFGPEPAPNSSAQNTIGTGTSDFSPLAPKKPKDQILSFIFVLKSPFQCIGLPFLLQLLQYIDSSAVYNDVIKLIIQFIVNLDDNIRQKTLQFRQLFLTRIFQEISQVVRNNKFDNTIKLKLQIYLNLIVQLINETEKDGLQTLQPHFSTVDGQLLKLKITNGIIGNKLYEKQPYVVEVTDNMTLWRFKQVLAEIYKESVNNIDVVKYVNPIDDTNLGKSLSDIHFFNQQTIKVQKRQGKQIPRYQLLSHSGEQLSQKFNVIVESWFNKYKNQQELMGLQEFKRLGNQNWRGNIIKQQKKLIQIISKYDQQSKGALNLDQFKYFFIRKSKQNLTIVWRLINLAGFKNNLKHMDESTSNQGVQTFPRKILSNRFVYDVIFQILQNETFQPVHLNFYKFLTMLETDHQFFTFLRTNIKDFLQNQKCIYRLSYGLQAFIKQLDSNIQIYASFYQQNGHLQIIKLLQSLFADNNKSIYSFDSTLKVYIIPNLLKILNFYIYPLVCENKFSRFFKKNLINHLDIPQLIKKLENEQNYAPRQEQRRQVLLSQNKINKQAFYELAYRIMQNLCVNFNSEYLMKVANQISRTISFLFLEIQQFNPSSVFNCVKSDSLNLRRASHNLIYMHLINHPEKAQQLVLKLTQNLPTDIKNISNSYYQILKFIIEKTMDILGDNIEANQFFTRLALTLFEYFFKMPNQKRNAIFYSKTLDGVLASILAILQKKPIVCRYLRNIRQQLIVKGLFFYNAQEQLQEYTISEQMLKNSTQPQLFSNYVKCKSQSSRTVLMNIIFQLYKHSEQDNSNLFPIFILPILNQLTDNTKKSSAKSSYVGLNNLGSTCYMNSMLQVLNIVEPFRNGIMMTQKESSLIKELKSLFSYLFFSERVDYIPKSLLQAFNPPINPGIQQDTTQFLNFLFDQLQFILKGTPYESLLEQLFKGNQVAQMICHNCGAKRQRVQQFFTYSVQIQGKYDLHSALQGMHAGELISDCLCQTCGQRSDTTKRNVLNQVPNIFFIHLKRIVFNYDIFANTKIFTRLYFPQELNFQPYTKQGLDLRQNLGVEYMKLLKDNQQQRKKFEQLTLHGKSKENYKLKLKGIIIHSGTPDVGHYYSVIKKSQGWIKYDDSRVSVFPQMQFQEQCYGGTFQADEWGGNASSKNAYVLIYEKQLKKYIEIRQSIDDQKVKKLIPFEEFKTFNTADWYKQVWLDNHILMLEQQLTSDSYNKQFLSFVCKMLQISQSEATLDTISQIFYKISLLSGEVGNLPDIFLKNVHLISFKTFQKYVISDPKRTFNLLFHHQSKVRDFAAVYLQKILIKCYKQQVEQNKQKIIAFLIDYLKSAEGQVAKNWMRIQGYFKLFERIVQSSAQIPQLYQFILSQDLIFYFIDFIMEKQSPIQLHPKKFSLGTKSNPANFTAALNFISFLLKRSFGFNGINYESPAVPQNQLFHLSDNAIICLSSMAFYQKMIKQNQNANAISTIIQRLSIQNPIFSLGISRVLLKLFNQNTDVSDQMDTVMLCISKLLRIKDNLWSQRAESILGSASPFIYDKNTLTCIDEQKYVYPSTLQNVFPLESLLSYTHINRNRAPLTVINMIKTILQATSASEHTMDFLIRQPAPSYLHLRYINWIHSYINQVLSSLTIPDKKREQVINKISICNLYLDDLFKRIAHQDIPFATLVIGQMGKKVLVDTFTDNNNQVTINLYNVPVWGVQSLPNGKGNSTFDQLLTNGRLETHVTDDSNILKFFKHSSKPLAIKPKNIEEQDKQIQALFDDEPYPKKNNQTPMEIQLPQQKSDEKVIVLKLTQQSKEDSDTQKNLQTIPEIIYSQVNLENAKEYVDYLCCLEVVNNTQSSKVAHLSISRFQNSNSTIPYQLKIMVNKTNEEYWYTKTNPYAQKGQLMFNIFVSDYIENSKLFCKTYGIQPINSFAELKAPQSVPKEQVKTSEKDNNLDGFEQINCPVCTFLNPRSNSACDVCGSALQ